MNNFIKYFYNINVEKVIYNDKYYSFIYNDYVYRLYIYNDTTGVDFLYKVNKMLVGNTLMSEIIINKYGNVLCNYNGITYILIKIYVNINKKISLEEIAFISKYLYRDNILVNWGILWSNKIDYLEDLINENGKKYPIVVDSFNYFVGMAENAISYFNSITLDNNYKYSIGHKIIRYNDTIEALYNPINIVFDYKVRDVAEYVKNSFFNNNENIFNELELYLRNNSLSIMEIKLLVSRLLYPSFYFDMYEDILIDNKEEKIILDIISRLDNYEEYLSKVISFFRMNYDIDEIDWIKKRRT